MTAQVAKWSTLPDRPGGNSRFGCSDFTSTARHQKANKTHFASSATSTPRLPPPLPDLANATMAGSTEMGRAARLNRVSQRRIPVQLKIA